LPTSLANARRSRALLPLPGSLDLTKGLPPVPAVSVVVPTRNERDNVVPLIRQLATAFQGASWEVVFVDDSSDDTCRVIREAANELPTVRLHHRGADARTGGLGGAVALGFGLARGEVVVVMDGDLQHPPALAPVLAGVVASGAADLAIASRYVPGGAGTAGLDGPRRVAVSQGARLLSRLLLPRARGVRDPLGGYFAVRRSVAQGAPLKPNGYKILLELLVKAPWSSVVEVPFTFGSRHTGTSKATVAEGARFARHLSRLALAQTAAR
jgi:dolichol-phosphate mannosyltransferase